MSVSASAAEAAIKSRHSRSPDTVAGSPQGNFNGRRVSKPAGAPQHLRMRGSREKAATAGVGREAAMVGSKQATAAASAPTSPQPAGRRSREVSVRGANAESFEGRANSAPPEPGSHAAGLPWLTATRHAHMVAMDRQLTELQAEQSDPQLASVLCQALKIVYRAERCAFRADALLRKSRVQTLNDAEYRDLFLFPGFRPELAADLAGLREKCAWLLTKGNFAPERARLLIALHVRLEETVNCWPSSGPLWPGVPKRLETLLPANAENHVAPESFVVPGMVLGGQFAQGYPSEGPGSLALISRFFHVPDLALTGLTDGKGQTLFWGLRHGIFDARIDLLDSRYLARREDDVLASFLDDWLVRCDAPEAARQLFTRTHLGEIRESDVALALVATEAKQTARQGMLRELAAAALYADAAMLRQALDGEVVQLRLFSIALLRRDDLELWARQRETMHAVDQGIQPLEFEVRGPVGTLQRVAANVEIRQIRLLEGRQRMVLSSYRAVNAPAILLLLGMQGSPALGGEAGERIAAMRSRVAELREWHAEVADIAQDAPQPGDTHAGRLYTLNNRSIRLGEKIARLERNIRTLDDAGRQLKALWINEQSVTVDANAHIGVAARFALMAHLMGETPLMSCMSKRNFTSRLDTVVKSLATYADSNGGHLPPLAMVSASR